MRLTLRNRVSDEIKLNKWLNLLPLYYRGADKSLARPTSRCILFDGENISFDASLIYIYFSNYDYK